MDLKFSLRGIDGIKSFLQELPRGTRIRAMEAIAKYIIGNDNRGLKHYPARVEHGPENPYQWQSEKQRRAYFATNGFGKGIPYRRTNELKDAWTYTSKNSDWTMVKLHNNVGYAPFVHGDGDTMQRGHAADGWRRISKVVMDNLKGAMAAGRKAVAEYLRSKK